MKKLSVVLLFGLIAATQNSVWAQGSTPAVTITGGGFLGANSGTYGWAFTLSQPITITDLGWFDFGGNGLNAAHPVGIWTSAGALVLSGTVPSGTGTEVNSFLYTSVTPTLLPVGSYVIAGFENGSSGDPITVGASTITPAAGIISYDGSRSAAGGSLTFPPSDPLSNGNSYFGPNFLFTAVPEPSTTALLLLTSSVASIFTWFRRRQSASC